MDRRLLRLRKEALQGDEIAIKRYSAHLKQKGFPIATLPDWKLTAEFLKECFEQMGVEAQIKLGPIDSDCVTQFPRIVFETDQEIHTYVLMFDLFNAEYIVHAAADHQAKEFSFISSPAGFETIQAAAEHICQQAFSEWMPGSFSPTRLYREPMPDRGFEPLWDEAHQGHWFGWSDYRHNPHYLPDELNQFYNLLGHFEEADEDEIAGPGAVEEVLVLLPQLKKYLRNAAQQVKIDAALHYARSILYKDPGQQNIQPLKHDDIRAEGYTSAECEACDRILFDDGSDDDNDVASVLCDRCYAHEMASSVTQSEWNRMGIYLEHIEEDLESIEQMMEQRYQESIVRPPLEPMPPLPDTPLRDLLDDYQALSESSWRMVGTDEGPKMVELPGNMFSDFVTARIMGKEVWIETPGRQNAFIAEWAHRGINRVIADSLDELYIKVRSKIANQVIPDTLPEDLY